MAVDRNVLLAFAPSGSREVRLGSLDFPGEVVFSLDEVPGRRGDDWGNYPRGAALALRRRHRLGEGIVGVVSGELHGGGVSSSAAVGVAYLLALRGGQRAERPARGERRPGPGDRERLPRPAQRHPRPGGHTPLAPRAPPEGRLRHRRSRTDPRAARPAAVHDPPGLLRREAVARRDRVQPEGLRMRRGGPGAPRGRGPRRWRGRARQRHRRGVRRPSTPPERRPGPPRRPLLLRGRPRPARRRSPGRPGTSPGSGP